MCDHDSDQIPEWGLRLPYNDLVCTQGLHNIVYENSTFMELVWMIGVILDGSQLVWLKSGESILAERIYRFPFDSRV